MDFDIVIKNGHVIDGTGNPWFKADIGVKDGKIAKISTLPLKHAEKAVDAKGYIVCPGFINLHSHSDGSIMFHNNAENCLSMGLTTELTGQCGNSMAPITEKFKKQVRITMNRRISPTDVEIDWLSLDDWIKKLEKTGIGINIAPLAGHGTIRSCVMGVEGEGGERIAPTSDEMEKMKEMLEQAMKDGAFGLSTGLNYSPGRNALTKEIVELAKIVAKHGGLYASHMRCEGDKLLEATKEFIHICKTAGIRGTIAHHKASGRNNYGKACETIRMVQKARSDGVDVIIDQYPWVFGGTIKSLGARFIPTRSALGIEKAPRRELVEKLKDPKKWENLKASVLDKIEKEREGYNIRKEKMEELGGWTSTLYALDPKGTVLFSKTHPELIYKSFKDVAKYFEVDDIWEGIRSLLLADEGHTVAGGEPYSEDDIVNIMKYPWTTISTDQYALDDSKVSLQDAADALGMQNPRGWGTYPKILGEYVRQKKVLTIEEAIRKMTSLPAQFLQLQDRGLVKEGFSADLIVFEPENVACMATYGNPQIYPKGIPYVLINGQMAVENSKYLEALSGKVLRKNM